MRISIDTLYSRYLECEGVTTDTRNCRPGLFFVALRGASFNGNAFAKQALQAGCKYALIDDETFADSEKPNLILVDDCLSTLQLLASYHRRRMGTRIIGITGTNGKTTTKELITAVLRQKYNVICTQGNLNNHIGVPLTLLSIKPEHDLAVVEMGANHPGEIRMLANLAEPDYGIITNVGKAHLEGFGSFEGVISTKGELYDYLRHHGTRTVFVQHENKWLNPIAHDLYHVTYGLELEADISGAVTGCNPYLSFRWTDRKGEYQVDTQLVGTYNLDNLLAATAVGCYFGVDSCSISAALAGYVPQNNRSQLKQTASNRLIVDAYNANPTSMLAALENFKLLDTPHKMVILGDMKELGTASHSEHLRVTDFISQCGFERVILVGEEFGKCNGADFEHYASVEEFADTLRKQKPEGASILIKGSNSMRLSALVELL